MTGLVATIHQHYPAVEADFQRYYQLDLTRELYTNDIPARRVEALVQWLPPEAATWRSMGRAWTTDQELAAITIEMLDSLRRLYIQAHTKQGAKQPDPIHIPRPWDQEKPAPRRGTTLQEMLRMGVDVRQPGPGGEQ